MNETERSAIVQDYLDEVREQFDSGQAIEQAYRPALKRLMSRFDDTVAVNDPKHSEHGAPDFVFLKKSNTKIIKGHAEAKDVDKSLDKVEKTEQMQRYAGYANLFLTDYLEFRFFRNGEKYETVSLGQLKNGRLYLTPENGVRLTRELEAFLEQAPERIRSGKRLAQIMGGKARRIRDNVDAYLSDKSIQSEQFDDIYELMKRSLVHDLSKQKFADMYAQTLVYGLFVARYSDNTPDSFTRSEARDLVPRSNPFLRKFFDHIAGADFDTRLTYIVDELCEVFSVSDVADIVHKHLRIQDASSDAKDPIIHFYEDFLQEYDPKLRQQMGAYYTPVPVVRYIVRQVDRILKEEFGISKGLASNETVIRTVDTQPWRKKGERKDRTTRDIALPRVQILDPAVGTATFLNETIKFIHGDFKGQEGQWPSYVNSNLLERLHGFELMMAPYTIAHLKLGMTLQELGVKDLTKRLGVYLTNTLEPGDDVKVDIFSALGLAGAVSEESRLASIVKNETPVMVVIGNPPYSNLSSNMGHQNMVQRYKQVNGARVIERGALQLEKNLNDDYVKFIAFAEDMIAKNGTGIVALITNNNYLDGPTMRGLRWNLANDFDNIHVINLHGNSKKKEKTPTGETDENVFDIMQGVAIMLASKHEATAKDTLADVYYADVWGSRREDKFRQLETDDLKFEKLPLNAPNYDFVVRDWSLLAEYESGVSLANLFRVRSTGVATARDALTIDIAREKIVTRVEDFANLSAEEAREKYKLGSDTTTWKVELAQADARKYKDSPENFVPISYRPFDKRWTLYTGNVVGFYTNPRKPVMQHFLGDENIGLCFNRAIEQKRDYTDIFIFDGLIQHHALSIKEVNSYAPLWLYYSDGTRDANFNADELKRLAENLGNPTPDDILDYIYAVLYSPSYRKKYSEFLKTDFPRVPIPTQADFDRLVLLGHELRELHLMKSPAINEGDTTFPEAGSNIVEKLTYTDGKVWINSTQYFGNVPELAWNFYIGGYQPAQKWLKDRKGRTLSYEDIDHYQQIVNILLETDRIMHEIG